MYHRRQKECQAAYVVIRGLMSEGKVACEMEDESPLREGPPRSQDPPPFAESLILPR